MYEADSSANFSKFKSPTAKFGTQQRDTGMGKGNDIPGPGNYSADVKQKLGGFKIGQKINQKGSNNPGPGQYDVNDSPTKNNGSGFKMGTSTRNKNMNSRSISEMPGPGNYDLNNQNGKSSAYTFGAKTK
jgi:hypothetical protein